MGRQSLEHQSHDSRQRRLQFEELSHRIRRRHTIPAEQIHRFPHRDWRIERKNSALSLIAAWILASISGLKPWVNTDCPLILSVFIGVHPWFLFFLTRMFSQARGFIFSTNS